MLGSVSQPPGVQPVNTVCLQCCAVSCFNKGPQGLAWALTDWAAAGGGGRAAKLTRGKGCFSNKVPGPQFPTPDPTPGWVCVEHLLLQEVRATQQWACPMLQLWQEVPAQGPPCPPQAHLLPEETFGTWLAGTEGR